MKSETGSRPEGAEDFSFSDKINTDKGEETHKPTPEKNSGVEKITRLLEHSADRDQVMEIAKHFGIPQDTIDKMVREQLSSFILRGADGGAVVLAKKFELSSDQIVETLSDSAFRMLLDGEDGREDGIRHVIRVADYLGLPQEKLQPMAEESIRRHLKHGEWTGVFAIIKLIPQKTEFLQSNEVKKGFKDILQFASSRDGDRLRDELQKANIVL
ncbi:MAG: hypothetical protein WCT27_04030 [Patescibacteria group bacterium]|jgi:hypothetical protein